MGLQYIAKTHLERVDLGHRFLTTILLVAVSEEHDIFAHSLHIWVVLHDLVVLQFRIQDCSVRKYIIEANPSAEKSPYRIW
jgi:hypothetical protein